ncbi:lysozyme inhibitor LprI family protein [Vreelandella lutescens]|nr:lysozyme inhibitor LprI family protein [Halomonas lutescens]
MRRIVLAVAGLSVAVMAMAEESSLDCDHAMTTLDINQCTAVQLESAQSELSQYVEASVNHHVDDPELLAAIEDSQQAWEAYAAAHCDAVHTQWREGSIRGVMALTCKTQLTQQRTHTVWESFLTYMDSTPPVLPEPSRLIK